MQRRFIIFSYKQTLSISNWHGFLLLLLIIAGWLTAAWKSGEDARSGETTSSRRSHSRAGETTKARSRRRPRGWRIVPWTDPVIKRSWLRSSLGATLKWRRLSIGGTLFGSGSAPSSARASLSSLDLRPETMPAPPSCYRLLSPVSPLCSRCFATPSSLWKFLLQVRFLTLYIWIFFFNGKNVKIRIFKNLDIQDSEWICVLLTSILGFSC